jgi:hypothetical protein
MMVEVDDISVTRDAGPTQPPLQKFPQTVFGNQKRAFNASLYKRFPFIEYSVKCDAVYCFTCRQFPSRVGGTGVSCPDPAFTKRGYRNWKRCHAALSKHSVSDSHLQATAYWDAWRNSEKTGTVAGKVEDYANKMVEKNRDVVSTLARIGILCGRQGLALRGHRESCSDPSNNSGNFLSLVQLMELENVGFKDKLKTLPKNARYISKDSQNEIMHAAVEVVLDIICSEIKGASCFSVIADEARDVSKSEQMSICIRYLLGDKICERFIEFVSMVDCDARSLCDAIVHSLQARGLDLKKCVAQCYDGASVMSGKHAGVQQLFRERCDSPCIYVHCHAHRVNLVLVDCCKSVTVLGDVIGLMEAIYCFLTASVQRHAAFKQTQMDAGLVPLELPMQSDTRWVCKHRAVKVFVARFGCILRTLRELSANGNPRERAEAKGLVLQLSSFESIFVLQLLDNILPLINSLSEFLQTKSGDTVQVCSLVEATKCSLMQMRNDEAYRNTKDAAATLANDNNISVSILSSDFNETETLPKHRPRALPQHLDNSVVMSTVGYRERQSNDVHILKRNMFEIIDKMVGELDRRFSGNESLLRACCTIDPSSTSFLQLNQMLPIVDTFAYLGLDIDNLKAQVSVASNMFRIAGKVSNSHDVLVELLNMKVAFPDLLLFTQIVLTIPIASASAERSFSTMKRVKTYLRSTMTDQRLNDLCLLAIEREMSHALLIDPSSVIDKFALLAERKLPLMKHGTVGSGRSFSA